MSVTLFRGGKEAQGFFHDMMRGGRKARGVGYSAYSERFECAFHD